MPDLGAKMRKIREARGYSQSYIADQMGISRPYYSQWENGDRNINGEQLIEFSKIVGVTLDYFSNATDDEKLFQTLAELSSFFQSEGVPEEDKDKALQDIMSLYLKSKEKGREEKNGNKDTSNTDGGSAKIPGKLK